MRLVIGDIFWEPDEILFLAQTALQIPKAKPQGDGTHLSPFQMTSVGQWYTASVDPPAQVNRAFYVVGGRLLHRRLNRVQAKYSDYITECGPWNEKTMRAIDLAKTEKVQRGLKTHIEPTAEEFQTRRFDKPARWYTRNGSGVDDDSDLKDLGGIGPTYNSLQDAIESLLRNGEDTSVPLARTIRGCLMGTVRDAPASIACLTAAWFIGEVKRHPRSLLSALILLDLVEGKHSADQNELFHADVFTFQKVISRQSQLPHPMSGKGTVERAEAAQGRTTALRESIDKIVKTTHGDDPLKIDLKIKRGGPGLNTVEARESEIMIRWLARRLHEAGHRTSFDNKADKRERVKIQIEGEKLYYSGLITSELKKRIDSLGPMI
jgi:hypothetical protein